MCKKKALVGQKLEHGTTGAAVLQYSCTESWEYNMQKEKKKHSHLALLGVCFLGWCRRFAGS